MQWTSYFVHIYADDFAGLSHPARDEERIESGAASKVDDRFTL